MQFDYQDTEIRKDWEDLWQKYPAMLLWNSFYLFWLKDTAKKLVKGDSSGGFKELVENGILY